MQCKKPCKLVTSCEQLGKELHTKWAFGQLPGADLELSHKWILKTKSITTFMLSYTHFLASNNTPAQLLHSGCRYGVTFYDLVISVFMAVGRSADGLCKLVRLRGSCGEVKERIRALLQLKGDKQRWSALFWSLLHFTLYSNWQTGVILLCDRLKPSN